MKSTAPSVSSGRTACRTPSAMPPDAHTVTAMAPTRCLASSSSKLLILGLPLYILTVSLLLSTRPFGLEMKSLMRRHCLRPFMRRTSSIHGRTHSKQSGVGTVQMRTIFCVAVVPLLKPLTRCLRYMTWWVMPTPPANSTQVPYESRLWCPPYGPSMKPHVVNCSLGLLLAFSYI